MQFSSKLKDPSSQPDFHLKFCKHLSVSEECTKAEFSGFPFHNYVHICLAYTQLISAKTDHVRTELKVFVDGQLIHQGKYPTYYGNFITYSLNS